MARGAARERGGGRSQGGYSFPFALRATDDKVSMRFEVNPPALLTLRSIEIWKVG